MITSKQARHLKEMSRSVQKATRRIIALGQKSGDMNVQMECIHACMDLLIGINYANHIMNQKKRRDTWRYRTNRS